MPRVLLMLHLQGHAQSLHMLTDIEHRDYTEHDVAGLCKEAWGVRKPTPCNSAPCKSCDGNCNRRSRRATAMLCNAVCALFTYLRFNFRAVLSAYNLQ